MFNAMSENLNKLISAYKQLEKSCLFSLDGKKGTGKTTVIDAFIEKVNNCIIINPYKSTNYLSPYINALHQYYEKIDIVDKKIQLHNREYTYEEAILEHILKICNTSKCCLIINGYTKHSTELLDFTQKVICTILRNSLKCMVLVEVDQDDYKNLAKLQYIYKIHSQEHILFPTVTDLELKTKFIEEYDNPKIDTFSLDYIIKSAENNPALFNIIINYLKHNNFLYLEDGKYICDKLTAGILTDILKEELMARYNRLDNMLKHIFLKSSMIGMEFDITHLSNSFKLISTNESLKKIEILSNLITRNNKLINKYVFVNDEAFMFAYANISDEQKREWSEILYHYYFTLWEQTNNSTVKNRDELIFKIAIHAMNAGKFEETVQFYIAAVFVLVKENNYKQALITINQIENLLSGVHISKLTNLHLKEFEASCYEQLGLYEKACEKYKNCIRTYSENPFFDLMNARYQLAFCTYYTSKVDLAISMTEDLKKDLEFTARKDALYYKTVSLLATLYREKAHPKTTELFLLALNECKENNYEYEYYVQLRKADLCYDVKLSLPMVRCAACYFYRNKYNKEYGKAVHNLGTDYLYVGNKNNAYRNLIRSKNVFGAFGSVDEVYAINCLGVWEAAFNYNYSNAINYFQDAQTFEINDFKKMTIWANMAGCFQKLHQYDKCLEYIKKCDSIPARKKYKDVGFYQRTVVFALAFYHMEQKQYEKSLSYFRSCFEINLKNEQLYLASACIIELCQLLDLVPSETELKYSHMSHNDLYQKYYEEKYLLHTLRFIE